MLLMLSIPSLFSCVIVWKLFTTAADAHDVVFAWVFVFQALIADAHDAFCGGLSMWKLPRLMFMMLCLQAVLCGDCRR